MNTLNSYNFTTSPLSQPTRKLRRLENQTLRSIRLSEIYNRRNLNKKIKGKSEVKELDAETGLYYYGARYLDPRTSRWLSGDPAMGEYVPSPRQDPSKLGGMGGVYNIINLHAYHYAGNNPIKYIDPDGRQSVPPYVAIIMEERNKNTEPLLENINNNRQQRLREYTTISMTDNERNMLYAAVLSESTPHPNYTEGEIVGITSVILNRVLENHRGKNTIEGVITDPGQINGITNEFYRYAMSSLTNDNSHLRTSDSFNNTERSWLDSKLNMVRATVDNVLSGNSGYFHFQTLGKGRGPLYFGSLEDYYSNSPIFAQVRTGQRWPVYREADTMIFR